MQHNKVTPEWVVLAAITCYYRSLISRLPHSSQCSHSPHIPHICAGGGDLGKDAGMVSNNLEIAW